MNKIERSKGENATERLLSEFCDNTFLKLWVYPNPYKSLAKELCDVLVVFENHIFIFSVKDIKFNTDKSIDIAWSRWKREAIDNSIKQIFGAERWIKKFPDRVYLDANCTIKFPFEIKQDNLIIHRIVVANGSELPCKEMSNNNIAGSLAIIYGDSLPNFGFPFQLSLDKNNIIHVLDSYNLKIILQELDTISDLSSYFLAKEEAIKSLDMLSYCGEEDLLAHYFLNYDEINKKHYIGVKGEKYTGLNIAEGEWFDFIKSPTYLRKKEIDKTSYFWDKLLQKTSQNALNGTLLGANIFDGINPIIEMAKEPRFMRRALSEHFMYSIQTFPETEDNIYRKVSAGISNYSERAYVLLQLKYNKNDNFEEIIRPKRTKMLAIACGVFKNRNPNLKKIIGIAINSPKYCDFEAEDFILLNCEKWSKKDKEYYENENKLLNFFGSNNLVVMKSSVSEFPEAKELKPNKIGRNDLCPCGSGKKYKKCCINHLN